MTCAATTLRSAACSASMSATTGTTTPVAPGSVARAGALSGRGAAMAASGSSRKVRVGGGAGGGFEPDRGGGEPRQATREDQGNRRIVGGLDHGTATGEKCRVEGVGVDIRRCGTPSLRPSGHRCGPPEQHRAAAHGEVDVGDARNRDRGRDAGFGERGHELGLRETRWASPRGRSRGDDLDHIGTGVQQHLRRIRRGVRVGARQRPAARRRRRGAAAGRRCRGRGPGARRDATRAARARRPATAPQAGVHCAGGARHARICSSEWAPLESRRPRRAPP